MNTRISWAASATAALLLLSGCATTVSGSAHAGSPLPRTASAETPAAEPTETPDSPVSEVPDPVESATPTEEPEIVESSEPIPPVAPETEADDGAIYAESIAWLSSFCYDFSDINDHFDVESSGAGSAEEAVQQIADGYDALIEAIYNAAYELDGLALPTFPGGSDFANLVHDWTVTAISTYQQGKSYIASGTYESSADLQAAISAVESEMDEPLEQLNQAIRDLDPVATAIMGELPECAFLS